MWLCEARAPFIYLTAITLEDRGGEQISELERIAARDGEAIAVCDCWSRFDLHDLGFEKFEEEAWYVRGAGGDLPPAGVELVTEPEALAEFESANTDGFEAPELHDLEPFGVYGKALLEDDRIRVFTHREGGRVVSGSMACVSAGVIGVYAVATVPAFRRRGFGEAVTRAALGAGPSLPAILQPSPEGAALYRAMGFEPVGRYTKWLRFP